MRHIILLTAGFSNLEGVARLSRHAVAACALLALLPLSAAGEAQPHEVLLLHSFEIEYAPFDAFSRGFRTEMSRRSRVNIIFYDLSVTLTRSDETHDRGPLLRYLQSVFDGHPPDLVVTVGGPAAQFFQAHRKALFPGVPGLLTAVDQTNLQPAALTSKDAVASVRNDHRRVVAGILDLLPATRHLYVVIGASEFERQLRARIVPQLRGADSRVDVTFLNDLSFDQVLTRSRTLPPGSAILYVMLAVDAAGVPHSEAQALPALHAAANAPIFGLHSTQLGRGVVGGPVMAIEPLVASATRAALRLIDGEAPSQVITPTRTTDTLLFDWRELQRWGITTVPHGSTVLFREPTLWEQHRWPILGALSIGFAQAVLILGLVTGRVRRQRAERALIESGSRLTAILDAAGEGIITIDQRGVIEGMNAAAEAIFGCTGHEAVGQHVNAFMPFIYREGTDGADPKHPHVIALREVRGRRRDGTTVPLEVAVRETALVDRRVFTCVVSDITERKRAEEVARGFSGRLLQAQEAERARIARELHDDVTQRLARLAIDASRIERGHKQAGTIPFRTVRELRDGLIRLGEEVHRLAYQLHPSFLEHVGLDKALKVQCDEFAEKEGIPVTTNIENLTFAVPKDSALCLMRIAQEALHNVARHAQANAVMVSLRVDEGGLTLEVADTGVGFDWAHVSEQPTLGLSSMRERLEMLGGNLQVESVVGHGTSVVAWLPIAEEQPWARYASS